ncbi:hypothetical protein BN8_00639 [Fibrisoma limi BUZ 3]|uniref:Uncharacterized protein n=1 Tax=Fibrisoma limi BUZ 3 TaxID=1185876 RepID=I2GCS2_9BACT|nr:hypothetical protein BN8_00639 [Fibrisoma limi BUZ 3]
MTAETVRPNSSWFGPGELALTILFCYFYQVRIFRCSADILATNDTIQ